jgi:hypothetical protein
MPAREQRLMTLSAGFAVVVALVAALAGVEDLLA